MNKKKYSLWVFMDTHQEVGMHSIKFMDEDKDKVLKFIGKCWILWAQRIKNRCCTMKKIILVETSSNSELELRVIENAIDRAIKECERDADDYVETSVFVDNEAIERCGDIYLEYLQAKRRNSIKDNKN